MGNKIQNLTRFAILNLDVYGFWNQFKSAYAKKDNNSLSRLIQLPIRENLLNSSHGDNPTFSLPQFLLEANYLKNYNLTKSSPSLNQALKKYAIFEGYQFDPGDQIYEVKLKRSTNSSSGFEMTLYIKLNNGVFKLFAFGPETSFNNVGD